MSLGGSKEAISQLILQDARSTGHLRSDSKISSDDTATGADEEETGSLRDQINERLKANGKIGLHQEGYYLSDKQLYSLLAIEKIRTALGLDIHLAEYIWKYSQKTFATIQLVFKDPKAQKLAMQAFEVAGFTDEALESKNLAVCIPRCKKSDKACQHRFPSLEPWDSVLLDNFKSQRWPFLVPTFDHKTFKYDFDHNRILPFKATVDSKEPKEINSGYFSDVVCVQMLADKQTMIPKETGTIIVAHKTLRPMNLSKYNIREAWLREAAAHRQLNGISPYLVRGIGAYRRMATNEENNTYHLVLEWADGGNLHSFWESNLAPQLNSDVEGSRQRLKMVIEQLSGLTEALMHMHYTGSSTSRQSRINDPDGISHQDPVAKSVENSSVPSVNIQATDNDSYPQRRQSDVVSPGPTGDANSLGIPDRKHIQSENWRHGDIKPENILRFIGGKEDAWLGTLKLVDLGRAQQKKDKTELRNTIEKERFRTRWYEPPDLTEDMHEKAKAIVAFQKPESRHRRSDPACQGQITRGSSTPSANARDMKNELSRILDQAKGDDAYLFSGTGDWAAHPLSIEGIGAAQTSSGRFGDSLLPTDAQRRSHPGLATRIATEKVYTNTILNTWQYPDDHKFARPRIAEDQIPCEQELCTSCNKVDIKSSELTFKKTDLDVNYKDCPLCTLVSKALKMSGLRLEGSIRLFKRSDNFNCYQNWSAHLIKTQIQVTGLKKYHLVPLICAQHRKIPKHGIRSWSSQKHGWKNATATCCQKKQDQVQLPLRFVDVRNPIWPKIVDSADLEPNSDGIRYIAFSHRWGDMPQAALTTKSNLAARRRKMPKMPKSFVDAIAITKALGCDYLWIDCLCINQGPDGDFVEQADSMQTTFSNAYCVIAASSAEGAKEGFVKRKRYHAVKLGPVYVSAVTNDFGRDVLRSGLNRRGWVLQERALARRTIFFTKNQIDEVAFLGDADFPSKTIGKDSTSGKQIHLWTNLYKQYSELEFSHVEDRPYAIAGLMARLTTAFRTQSLAGLFESFWGRCLLWKRAEKCPQLEQIPQGEQAKKLPPSWSWMAVDGPIDFIDPEGGTVTWNEKGNDKVVLPFATGTGSSRPGPDPQPVSDKEHHAIFAQAFDFTYKKGEPNRYLVYDDGRQHIDGQTKCVTIGTSNNEPTCYVVLVSRSTPAATAATYKRVGFSHISADSIRLETGQSMSLE
ncbi:HET-domain-containing protein [Lizonia empirigonia]|nr:HET-domain-containing protein [Lizonia empirigonia]